MDALADGIQAGSNFNYPGAAHARARVVTDLNGLWSYKADDKNLGEHYREQLHYSHADQARWMDEECDVTNWNALKVPGSWTRHGYAGVRRAWYRRHFFLRPDAITKRHTIMFDGVDYAADVWLNGRYLGSHEGYLGKFHFDVTGLLKTENTLVVKVEAHDDVLGEEHEIGQLKKLFKGALGRWDMNDPETKPAGIWGDVRLVQTGVVRIDRASLTASPTDLPPKAAPDQPVNVQGVLHIDISSFAVLSGNIELKWHVRPDGFEAGSHSGSTSFTHLAGIRTVSLDAAMPQTHLWWTWDLGQQRRYLVELELWVDGALSDAFAWKTGFRCLSFGDAWDLKLNGVSFFQRGANYLSDLDLASMSQDRYALDAQLFIDASLNTVHPFCVVEGDGFYEACDRAGLLVYQDFPIWTVADTSSEFAREASRQFDEMLERLGRFPSVAIWNFGSQPSIANFEKHCTELVRRAGAKDPSRIAHAGNSAVSYEKHDDVHPIRSFFWSESEAQRLEKTYAWRRDSHMYPGWYFGEIDEIKKLPRSHFGLVTEFGAQSLPDKNCLSSFCDTDSPQIDWSAMARRCLQPRIMLKRVPNPSSLDDLITRSQKYQAELLKHHIEYIRSLKGNPCRGLHIFAFGDCWPSVTWSIVDYERHPKAAYHEVAQSMRPVQAFWSDYGRVRKAGVNEILEFWLVNDQAIPIEAQSLTVAFKCAQGEETRFTIDVGAIGTDRAQCVQVPAAMPKSAGNCDVTIELDLGDCQIVNTYTVSLEN